MHASTVNPRQHPDTTFRSAFPRAGLAGLLLAILLQATGCTSLHTGPGDFRADFLPFYGSESDTTGFVDDVAPIALFRYTRDATSGEEVYRFLWPFGLYRTLEEESFFQFFPLIYHKRQLDPNGLPETNGFVFPLVFWGDSADEGFYFGNFFWGDLYGLFGKDELQFRGGTIYMHFRDEGYHSSHVLFPMVNWVWGDGHDGWRIWPFYGNYSKQDIDGNPVYDRTFAMWPFFTHQWNNLNNPFPSETLFFFPFYGSITSEHHSDHTLLWPLFRWSSTQYEDGEQWEVRAPFPFIQIGRGVRESKTFLWPLFGLKTSATKYLQYCLWPIQRFERLDLEHVLEERFWFLPIYWQYDYAYKTGPDAGTTRSEIKVWPLFKYRKETDGGQSVSLLSPLWFKDPEGFDAIWDPLFRVYHEDVRDDGSILTRVLWGLYSSLIDELGFSASIWPLLTDWGEVEGRGSWLTVLGGLWEHISRGGFDAYRLFWFPFGDELPEPSAPASEAEPSEEIEP